MGNGFLGEHGGKGVLWWHENHGYPFPPSLITTTVRVQQEETKVNPKGILLPPSSWGEPALVLVRSLGLAVPMYRIFVSWAFLGHLYLLV